MKVNRSLRTSGLWVTKVVTYIRTAPLLLSLIGAVADLGEGPGPHLILTEKKNYNEKTQKEEKPAGQAIFANQFCFNIADELFFRLVAKNSH